MTNLELTERLGAWHGLGNSRGRWLVSGGQRGPSTVGFVFDGHRPAAVLGPAGAGAGIEISRASAGNQMVWLSLGEGWESAAMGGEIKARFV